MKCSAGAFHGTVLSCTIKPSLALDEWSWVSEYLAGMTGPLSRAVFENPLMMYMLFVELGRERSPCKSVTSPPIAINVKKGTSLLV